MLTKCAFQSFLSKIHKFCSPKHGFLSASLLFENVSVVCATAPTSAALIIGLSDYEPQAVYGHFLSPDVALRANSSFSCEWSHDCRYRQCWRDGRLLHHHHAHRANGQTAHVPKPGRGHVRYSLSYFSTGKITSDHKKPADVSAMPAYTRILRLATPLTHGVSWWWCF